MAAIGNCRSLSDIIASVPSGLQWKLDEEIDFEHRNERSGVVVTKHLGRIADSMTEWEGAVSECLGLSESNKYDIKEKYPTKPPLQRRMALSIWKDRLGSKATYRALIQVFYDADMPCYADLVCNLFTVNDNKPSPPPSPPIRKKTKQDGTPEPPTPNRESPPEPLPNKGLCWCVNQSKDKWKSRSLSRSKMSRGTLQQKCLWDREVLYVKFLNDIPDDWFFRRGRMNLENIITLAQKWNPEGKKNIPKIREMKHDGTPHIRVLFTEDTSSYSLVGAEENDVSPNEPTMWLNLSQGGDDYKKHLVVHEFGHALGLDHEHQRGDLWKLIKPYVNLQVMESDRDIEGAYDSYIEDVDQDSQVDDCMMTTYDPDSVMHYWFKSSWLKRDYNTEQKVNSATDISVEEKKALLGILKQSKPSFVTQPSKLDLELLEKCYMEKKMRHADATTGNTTPSERPTTREGPPHADATTGNATPSERPTTREGPPAPNPNNWPWEKRYVLAAAIPVATAAVLVASFLLRRGT